MKILIKLFVIATSIILLFILVTAVTIYIDYINYKKVRSNKPAYITSTRSIKDMMPKLRGIEKCYWNGDMYNTDFDPFPIGPTDCWYKGYIFITAKEASRISKSYKWNEADNWKPSLDNTPLGATHHKCKWLISKEYTKSIGIYYVGDIYFDKIHSLLFFDLHTM